MASLCLRITYRSVKQSQAHRQWWVFKTQSFDTIFFFKIGKFYELLHMVTFVSYLFEWQKPIQTDHEMFFIFFFKGRGCWRA